MGIFRDSLKIVNEVVTLGGSGRLSEAKRLYKEAYDEYLTLYEESEIYKAEVEERLKAIGIALTNAKSYLELSERLIESGVMDKSRLAVCKGVQVLDKVDRFNSGFNSAINLGVGSIAGGSLAVGSWALIATLGSASTGAAISGLTGVAATNATLAWFGGGALAAGGAGMAGGAAVLGGLFAVPLIYFAAKGSHKKAKELEEAKIELQNVALQVREQNAAYPAIIAAVKDKEHETSILCEIFISDVVKHSGAIRPYGVFSMAMQKLRALFGREPFTRQQTVALELLTQSVTTFLTGLGIHEESGTSVDVPVSGGPV